MFYNSPKHKHSCCAIYRGAGGSGDATADSSTEALLVRELAAQVTIDAAAAASSKAAAEAAKVAAQLAETNAETAETNAETAETNAETAATASASSASAASASASTATTQASNASTSAIAASGSASAASTSATNASNSASTATTQATNASNSASAASTSATNASNSASAASGFADDASDFADAAAASAASIDVSGFMQKSANLSDVTNTSTARTNLGLVIGTNVQAWDADLDTWSTKTAPSGSVVGTSDTQTLTNKTINASQLVNSSVTPDKLSVQSQYTGFKNRILNGAMVIDQRNAGASVTANNSVFCADRWKFQASQTAKGTLQQTSVAPAGFVNSLLFTSTSAYSITSTDFFVHTQNIEGFNISDLGWGTANAQPVTLSFWVRSSLTGTFGGAIQNNAQDQNYPFSYTINSANTYEYKTITIAGATAGTWLTTNGRGINLLFSLGVGSTFSGTAGSWTASNVFSATGATSVVGTNGATFYITGVQLEKGSTATSFDYRPYGTELALCQRYCVVLGQTGGETVVGSGNWYTTTAAIYQMRFPVEMRANPTLTNVSPTLIMYTAGSGPSATTPTINSVSTSGIEFYTPVTSGLGVNGGGTSVRYTSGKSILSSEL